MATYDDDDSVLPKENEDIRTKKGFYQIVQLIGKGGYGAVYEVIRKSDKQQLAIKCENMSARKKVLGMDCKVLKGARDIKSRHFCTILDRGKVANRFVFIVMELIGKNLWDLRIQQPTMRFSIGTALKAAIQCLISIEELHRIGFLHRDIKPGNFAVGREDRNDHHIIYMLDFGLCRKYMVVKNKDIRTPRDAAPFRGTTRYAPLAAMKNIDQSRKDDLEGWLYMIVEWTSGGLPWKKLKSNNKTEVLKMKEELRANSIALDKFFSKCPKREFTLLLRYLDNLSYFSVPDYKYIFDLITHALKSSGVNFSDPIDWDESHEYRAPYEEPGDGQPSIKSVYDYSDKNIDDTQRLL